MQFHAAPSRPAAANPAENGVPPSSMQQEALAQAALAQPRFGFPRAPLVRRLQRAIMEQLHLGEQACVLGHRDAHGGFMALAGDDDFDGPRYTLRLRQRLWEHDVDFDVGILFGHYLLTVDDHRFDIAFLPALDEALLATAARWIARNLERPFAAR